MKNRKDGKMFSITDLDIRLARIAAMRQVGIILQANVFKATLKTISESIARSVGNVFMLVKAGL